MLQKYFHISLLTELLWYCKYNADILNTLWGRRDRMVVGLTTTYAIIAHHH